MRTNAKILLAVSAVLVLVTIIAFYGTTGQKVQARSDLGPVTFGEMIGVTGGAEGGDCIIGEQKYCRGAAFQFSPDCSGCAETRACSHYCRKISRIMANMTKEEYITSSLS